MVTVTSLTLHRILNSSARTKVLSTIFVVMVFLSLSGGKFASIVLLLLSDNATSQTDTEYFYYLANRLDSPLSTWANTAFSYVTLFVFFWNTVPMNIALYQIANRKSRANRTNYSALNATFKIDPNGTVWYLNLINVAIIVLYYVISFIATETTILGNDRAQLAISSINFVLVGLHCIVNFKLTDRVREILLDNIDVQDTSSKVSPPEQQQPRVMLIDAVERDNRAKNTPNRNNARVRFGVAAPGNPSSIPTVRVASFGKAPSSAPTVSMR